MNQSLTQPSARCEEQHEDVGGTGGDMAALTRARDEGVAARKGPAAPGGQHGR